MLTDEEKIAQVEEKLDDLRDFLVIDIHSKVHKVKSTGLLEAATQVADSVALAETSSRIAEIYNNSSITNTSTS